MKFTKKRLYAALTLLGTIVCTAIAIAVLPVAAPFVASAGVAFLLALGRKLVRRTIKRIVNWIMPGNTEDSSDSSDSEDSRCDDSPVAEFPVPAPQYHHQHQHQYMFEAVTIQIDRTKSGNHLKEVITREAFSSLDDDDGKPRLT